MKYIYSLYDAKTGELVHRGTPGELAKAGVFSTSEEASRGWGRQHLRGIVPKKWRIEREEAPVTHKKHSTPPDGPVRMVWVYRMYDAAGQPVCEGTAVELVRIERQKALRKIRAASHKPRKKREPMLTPKNAPAAVKACGIEHPDALQLDVHALCGYNAAARKLGHKELSYGHWAEKGKPEAPV